MNERSSVINYRVTDMHHIGQLFPLRPSLVVATSGSRKGVIIRFKTFYFKVYQAENEDQFLFQGFRYGEKIPVVDETVRFFQMRNFTAVFNQEDYLIRFQKPCEDPFCFLRTL